MRPTLSPGDAQVDVVAVEVDDEELDSPELLDDAPPLDELSEDEEELSEDEEELSEEELEVDGLRVLDPRLSVL